MNNDEESQLDRLLAEFLLNQEAGVSVDPEELMAVHPEFAKTIREFFDNEQQMQGVASLSTSPNRTHSPIVDTIRYFGDYELINEIARGGMGIVYRARQTSLNRVVAVKMMRSGQRASETETRRFRTEAEAAANLKHPNIVSIYEVGRHDGQDYFSMAYIEGQNLSAVIRDQPLPAKTAAKYVSQIAEAIDHAHQKGVLHRDLKPSNVLIDANNEVQITDFGLAMEHRPAGEEHGGERQRHREQCEPGELEPQARQQAERERDGRPGRERRACDDEGQADHGANR
jgi:serine/threonine protein kinase